MVDPGVLVSAVLSKDILHIKDFSSDKAALLLCSIKTVEAVVSNSLPIMDDQNMLVTVYSLLFLRLFVYAVNSTIPKCVSIRILWSAKFRLLRKPALDHGPSQIHTYQFHGKADNKLTRIRLQ